MKKNITFIFPFILFLIIIGFLYRGLQVNPHEIQSPLIDKSVPTFSAPSIFDSKKMIDEKIFRGHVSILNIFASWCVSCREEHPLWVTFHKNEPNVQIIGLAFKDNLTHLKAYLKKYGNPYSDVINDSTGSISINYGAYGTPETFVIDKGGVIRSKIVGPITPAILKNQLIPLINKLLKIK